MKNSLKSADTANKAIALSPFTVNEVGEALALGLQKEGRYRDSWREIADKNVYIDAAMRHIVQYQMGNFIDDESKKHHLAHAICNLMFLCEIDLERCCED